jgi:molybdopterin-guanine dinucleotide biosynthesis protein A
MPVVWKASDPKTWAPISEVVGVVLAGGKSSRYGENKALVRLNGMPLIERVIGVLKSIFRPVILITNTPHAYEHLNLPMHEDRIKGLGPLGGIYTALHVIPGDGAFVVGCDMPYLNGKLIQHMVTIRGTYDVVVPRIYEKIEALHALYGRSCLPAIQQRIDAGEYQTFRFFQDVSVRYVEEDEVRHFDARFRSFFNINRPEELEALEEDREGV